MSIEGYITLDQAAEQFNISARQLRRLCQRKQLDAEKIGGIWLVKPESVEAYCHSPKRRERKRPPRI